MYELLNLFELIKDNNLQITNENLKECTIKLNINCTDENCHSNLDILLNLKEICSTNIKFSSSENYFFNRDAINGNNISDFDNAIRTHLNKCIESKISNLTFTIKISKAFDYENININYFFKTDYIINILKNPIELNEEFNKLFVSEKFNLILIDQLNNVFENNHIKFMPFSEFNINTINLYKDKLVYPLNMKKQLENCSINFNAKHITPEIFYFDNFDDGELSNKLKNLLILSILISISTSTELNNDILLFNIRGKKVITIEYPLFYIDNKVFDDNLIKYIYQLYQFSYENKGIQCLYICRNVISLFLREKCVTNNLDLFIKQSKEILETCKNNLNIISIDDSNKYFSNRYTIFDFLDKSTESITKIIDDLIGKMNTFYLSTIASLVGSLLLFFKELNFNVLFISLIVYIIYILYFSILNFSSSYLAYKSNINIYNKKVESFKKILSEDERDSFEKSFKPSKRFKVYLFINILATVIIFLISFFILINFDVFKNFIKLYLTIN